MDLVYQNPTLSTLCAHICRYMIYVVFIGEHNPLVLLRLYINKWHVAHLQEQLSILTVSDAF